MYFSSSSTNCNVGSTHSKKEDHTVLILYNQCDDSTASKNGDHTLNLSRRLAQAAFHRPPQDIWARSFEPSKPLISAALRIVKTFSTLWLPPPECNSPLRTFEPGLSNHPNLSSILWQNVQLFKFWPNLNIEFWSYDFYPQNPTAPHDIWAGSLKPSKPLCCSQNCDTFEVFNPFQVFKPSKPPCCSSNCDTFEV